LSSIKILFLDENYLAIASRNRWFYTADSAVYAVERVDGMGEVFLYLGRGETNPIFNNIEEATERLIRSGDYIPSQEDVKAVKSAKTTLRVKLSDLILQGTDHVFRHFEIDTACYGSLNEHQRRVAERVYGSGEDFVANMKMLNEAGITKTRIYVLNPGYVEKNVKQNGALVRASRLGPFVLDSWFYAFECYVDLHLGLRGVRR